MFNNKAATPMRLVKNLCKQQSSFIRLFGNMIQGIGTVLKLELAKRFGFLKYVDMTNIIDLYFFQKDNMTDFFRFNIT